MKVLLLFVFAVVSAVSCYSRDTSIYNGKLTSNMDANGMSITNSPLPSLPGDLANKDYVDGIAITKQTNLVSGVNIKTINEESILGSGNIDIHGGGGGSGINTNAVRSLINESFVGGTNAVNTALDEYVPYISDMNGSKSAVTIGWRIGDVGPSSLAIGERVESSGNFSVAEGGLTISSNTYSHAEGYGTEANGVGSHAEGNVSVANGGYSHAEGYHTFAGGDYSHADGQYSHATNDNSYVWGGTSTDTYSKGEGTFSIYPKGGVDGFYVAGTNLTTLIGQGGGGGGLVNDVKTNGVSIVANKVADIYNPVRAIVSSASVTNAGAVADAAAKYLPLTGGRVNGNLTIYGSFGDIHKGWEHIKTEYHDIGGVDTTTLPKYLSSLNWVGADGSLSHTLSQYGITDAYTKTECDDKFIEDEDDPVWNDEKANYLTTQTASTTYQPLITAGDNITIANNTISATVPGDSHIGSVAVTAVRDSSELWTTTNTKLTNTIVGVNLNYLTNANSRAWSATSIDNSVIKRIDNLEAEIVGVNALLETALGGNN